MLTLTARVPAEPGRAAQVISAWGEPWGCAVGEKAAGQETAGVLERSGSSIHYWIAGPRRAPLVAFTHAAALDHRSFTAQLPVLWAAGYRTLRWDVRGHGRSRPLGTTPLTLGDVADDLLALLDQFLLGRQVCLVGHAFGARVAQQVLRQRPDRIAALVVIGALREGVRRSMAEVLSGWRRRAWRVRTLSRIRHELARTVSVVPEVQTYAFTATDRSTRAEILGVLRADRPSRGGDPDFRIEQPVLVAHGEFDRRGVVRCAATWIERDPRCRRQVVRRAGSAAHQDNPTVFNRLLLDFLTEHYPLPRGLHGHVSPRA